MRVMTAREASAHRRDKWTGYGRYFAENYLSNPALYDQHYGSADGYRRTIVRESWPQVSPHLKRYFREGFNAALAAA